MSWESLPGWGDDILRFYDIMAAWLPPGGKAVEIGVFMFRSLGYLGTLRPDLELWAIDPWEDGTSQGYDGPGEFSEHVQKHGSLFNAAIDLARLHIPEVFKKVHLIRARSSTVRPYLKADLVFIDGAHDETSVSQDIADWMDRLSPKGVLAGHDYSPQFPGVMAAVDRMVPKVVRPGWREPGVFDTVWFTRTEDL